MTSYRTVQVRVYTFLHGAYTLVCGILRKKCIAPQCLSMNDKSVYNQNKFQFLLHTCTCMYMKICEALAASNERIYNHYNNGISILCTFETYVYIYINYIRINHIDYNFSG